MTLGVAASCAVFDPTNDNRLIVGHAEAAKVQVKFIQKYYLFIK